MVQSTWIPPGLSELVSSLAGTTVEVDQVERRSTQGREADFDSEESTIFISLWTMGISTALTTEVSRSRWETAFVPRTDLGKRLRALRSRAVDSGMTLLSEEEILEEVKRRRGELDSDETYLR